MFTKILTCASETSHYDNQGEPVPRQYQLSYRARARMPWSIHSLNPETDELFWGEYFETYGEAIQVFLKRPEIHDIRDEFGAAIEIDNVPVS
jgi:hypothetical protein